MTTDAEKAAGRRPQRQVSNRIDEAAAQAAMTQALASYSQGFGTFFWARFLGLEIAYTEHACVIEMEPLDFMFNPQGSLHGGVISTILDISMGHLLNHASGPGVTLEMKVQFLRPVRHGRIRSEAVFIKRGRSINYLEARLVDAEQRLVATATSTWQLLPRDGGAEP
jgi:uncharacterized protein (TIGR00369 family)